MDVRYKLKTIELPFEELSPIIRGSNRLEKVGSFEFGPRFNFAYQLLYVIEGEGLAKIGPLSQTMKPGQCYLYGPHDEHHFIQQGDRISVGTINFSWQKETPEKLSKINKSVPRKPSNFEKWADPPYRIGNWPSFPFLVQIPIGQREHMDHLIEAVASNFFQPNDNQHLSLRADFLKILSIIQESLSPEQQGHEHPLIRKLQKYFHKHLHRDLDRNSVAKSFGLSPSHLTALLRIHGKTNFRALLTRHRMERAKELLQYSEQRIKIVASQVGFKDTSYFVRVFRETFGTSPQHWREKFR